MYSIAGRRNMRKYVVSIGIIASIILFAAAFMSDVCKESNEVSGCSGYMVSGSAITAIYMDSMNTDTNAVREEVIVTSYQSVIAPNWNEEESYLLAKLAMAEAESEDTEGKALVILVVLNRCYNEDFPNAIEEVIYEEGQFSPVSNGRFDEVEPDSDCWKALLMVEKGWDESKGATFFESKSKSTWHRKNLKFLFRHGRHMFYVAPQ